MQRILRVFKAIIISTVISIAALIVTILFQLMFIKYGGILCAIILFIFLVGLITFLILRLGFLPIIKENENAGNL